MQLPQNFQTAITAAAYITSRIAYPSKKVIVNPRNLQIDSQNIGIPSLESITESADGSRINIRPHLSLHVTQAGSFEVETGYSGLQRRIEQSLDKTGFTPTGRFGWRARRNLDSYGFLFNEEEWSRHLDSLAKRFPKEMEKDISLARGADINGISQAYIDALLAKEDCFLGIPCSNLGRATVLAAGAMAAAAMVYLSPGTQDTAQKLWQSYNDLLFNHGFAGTAAANSATTSLFYALGDFCAQYIEGRGFDMRRISRTAKLAAAYGAELTLLYSALNLIEHPNRLISSAAKGFVDICVYGIWLFNSRHIHLMSKEGELKWHDYFRLDQIYESSKSSAFRRKWKMLAAYGFGFWIPYQIWNRAVHEVQQQVGYVCAVVPPFSVFISLVSNEKRELYEFKQAMASLK